MSKRRTNKSKHEARVQPPVPSQQSGSVLENMEVAGMMVTWNALPDPFVEQLPREEKDRMRDLHDLVHHDPSAALPVARAMSIRYPALPCFRNWLVACYESLGDTAMANKEREDLFRDHPDYLFVRLATVEAMLQRGDLDAAETILFEKGRTLREIYPERTVFHVTEARNWLAICGRLAALQLKFDEARPYRDWLNELEPGSAPVKMMDRLLTEDAAASFSVLNALRKGLKAFEGTAKKRKPHTSSPKERQAKPLPEAASDQLELF